MSKTKELKQKIVELEKDSLILDTPVEEYGKWVGTAQGFTFKFLLELSGQKANNPNPDSQKLIESIPEKPLPYEEVFAQIENDVLTRGLNATSGRYMAYVPGGGIPTAAIADFLAAITNRYSGNYGACPPAAEIENVCVKWLIDMVGFPQGGWGVLTSGGTLAALTGLVAARNTREASEWHKGVIYMTSEGHHSIPKVLATIGLGHLPVRLVSVNNEFRMIPAELAKIIADDKKNGLAPWIVCATAGTTNTGAVDPLGEISKIAQQHGLWLHVDGAYGGFFVLTENGRKLLKDMALADSLVLDPHKSLFLPYGIGAALVRDANLLRSSFAYNPAYLQDLQQEKELSPSNFSIEGTRHFRGLRMWLSIKLHGLERFRKALDEKLLLAQYAYERLKEIEGIKLGPFPQLSCTTFRIKGATETESDRLTQKLLDQIQKRGIFYNSSTRLNGKLYQRLCILNFRTHLREVDLALEEIQTLSKDIRQSRQ